MKVKYYNIKEGKDKFCEIIRLVEKGFLIVITKYGKPVAVIEWTIASKEAYRGKS
jgi:antitoxin (DNA-binding transcriptional repressor) of toxin-antitoxin stability system